MTDDAPRDELEALEIRLLLEGVYQQYGYDFRDYAQGTRMRRIRERVRKEELISIAGLLELVLHDPQCMTRLIGDLSITVSEMFRDPGLFQTLRDNIVQLLDTYPFIRIWHAGCANGEEVYSLAILLHEENLLERCRIYATDMNEAALQQAQRGIFPLKQMQAYTQNHLAAGGKGSFSDYYTAKYDHARFRPWLKENVVFSQHNLTTDGAFNEFNIIFCRNVMIYFNKALQDRVHGLFYQSLTRLGYLILGSQESIRFSPHEHCFETVDAEEKIYRKIK
ncbi:MAG: protein-glutamate O-methyltransferase CheR [Gammaproteobacteria bacterium]|nr:protein-glutamate O-methyltransferase CheR [Gammaproteobacteria bacterium]